MNHEDFIMRNSYLKVHFKLSGVTKIYLFFTALKKIMAEAQENYIAVLEKKLAELSGIEVDQIKKNQVLIIVIGIL